MIGMAIVKEGAGKNSEKWRFHHWSPIVEWMLWLLLVGVRTAGRDCTEPSVAAVTG
jgi:hypothetical protein